MSDEKIVITPLGLRDYFASVATEVDIETHAFEEIRISAWIKGKKLVMSREEARYAYADAMMKARVA